MRVGWLLAALWVLAGCIGFAAQAEAQSTPSGGPQQFVVLRSETLIVPFDSLTSEQAQCAITGKATFASMRCQAPAGTAKASYHYITTLVVDQEGMAYGIACHQSLVDLWCKKFSAGIAIEGSFSNGQKSLSIIDGQRSHVYLTVASAFVGSVQPSQPAPSAKAAKNNSSAQPATGARASAAQPPQPTASDAAGPAGRQEIGGPAAASGIQGQGNPSGACETAGASCVLFTSEPQGADIYVDGKFVGNTPSSLVLPAGSHQLRIESGKFKPWTRTLESTAGSSVTVRATLLKK